MTAKEWLNRARTIDKELKTLEETKEVMVAKLSKATQTLTGDTIQSSKDPHKFDELGELVFQIEQAKETCRKVKAETLAVIMKVENSTLRQVLELRYIKSISWEEIAVEMNYSWRQVHRLHGRALIAVAEVIGGNEMPKHVMKACRWNPGVDCEKDHCRTCGWNPQITEYRKEKPVIIKRREKWYIGSGPFPARGH